MTKIVIQRSRIQFNLLKRGKNCRGGRKCFIVVAIARVAMNGQVSSRDGEWLKLLVDILEGVVHVVDGRPFEPGSLVEGQVADIFGWGAEP